ncbi:MAG: V-type ATP synthase subunit E family protein [Aigarchaeota archaeon]|nr:V-type ATP synthase subunit E family protein [Candidatus Pelearchaeum maunauluense]
MSSSALERVVREVVQEALAEFKQGLEEAGRQALKIVEGVEEETLREAEAMLEAGKRGRDTLRQRILSLAEINARNKSIAVLEEAVNNVLEKARERIMQLDERELEDALRFLLREAVDAIGAERVIVETNSAGLRVIEKVAREIEAEKKVSLSISRTPIEAVGVKARSEKGDIIYDNTIDARLERMRPLLRKEVAKLFTS